MDIFSSFQCLIMHWLYLLQLSNLLPLFFLPHCFHSGLLPTLFVLLFQLAPLTSTKLPSSFPSTTQLLSSPWLSLFNNSHCLWTLIQTSVISTRVWNDLSLSTLPASIWIHFLPLPIYRPCGLSHHSLNVAWILTQIWHRMFLLT